MAGRDGWTSPSELADYVYCPRSHWYRSHPPPGGIGPEAAAHSRAGIRYHARTLSAERRRATSGTTYWVGLLVGVALVVGGFLWAFYR